MGFTCGVLLSSDSKLAANVYFQIRQKLAEKTLVGMFCDFVSAAALIVNPGKLGNKYVV